MNVFIISAMLASHGPHLARGRIRIEIQNIEESFFKKVASDEYDVDQIKARGEMVNAEAAAKEQAEK